MKWLWGMRGYLLASLIALCTFRLFYQFHSGHVGALADATMGVLTGKPHWLAYQNRLLGPWLIELLSRTGLSFTTAWWVFHGMLLQGIAWLLLFLLRKENLTTAAALGCITAFMAAFILFQHPWYYPWDTLDLLIFTVVAWAIFRRPSPRWLVVLFLIALLNRESALFIALYLIIDAWDLRPFKLQRARQLVIGTAAMIGGIAYTHIIRHALFISTADGQPDTAHQTIGNHWRFHDNLRDVLHTNVTNANALYTLLVFGMLACFAASCRRMRDAELKCFVMLLALTANIMMFGYFNEIRMHIILFPFVLFLGLSLTRGASARAHTH